MQYKSSCNVPTVLVTQLYLVQCQLVEAFEQVEQGLNVIGATAVEDKLQVGVKETIEKLRIAGIKVNKMYKVVSETYIKYGYQ